ncbi:MAG: SH3 domain-containing protein [Desulfovibrio sp.]|nr:SH3 domain-containing protein [Desulfovibrio sp.]
MKKLAALLLVLGLAAPAFAGQPRVLVVDPDRAGTNVRDAPSGSVIDVIPYASPSSPDSVKERRVVRLLANEGKWFKVAYDGGQGYVHQSMLGVFASGTEDGNPVLFKAPSQDAMNKGRIADGTRARPLAFFVEEGGRAWLKVEILEVPRKGAAGWLIENAFLAIPSEENLNSCWRRRKLRSQLDGGADPSLPPQPQANPQMTALRRQGET